MSNAHRLALAGSITIAACGGTEDPIAEEVAAREDAFSLASRAETVKGAAWAHGVSNGLLVAGVAKHESGLAQCWSEATWACAGPHSPECGGPVLAGSGDGPCSIQQGGIGMFQFDAGTWWQTLSAHGDGILSVGGNAGLGADFIVGKVFSCPNTPDFASHDEARAWLAGAVPGTDEFETFLTAMAWCYNGCAPSFKSCNHWAVREAYRKGVQSLLDSLGWDFWYGPPSAPEPDCGTEFSVFGGIRDEWLSLGGCESFLGAPTTNEEGTPDGIGRYSYFTGSEGFPGAIYWTPSIGAHEVHGVILQHWASLGWETSGFGYPVSDEYGYDGSDWGMPGWVAESEFEGGWISFAYETGEIFEWSK